MSDITGLTAFASPNIDVARVGAKKSEQQKGLQDNIDLLKHSNDGYDIALAPLLDSALDLSRERESNIQIILNPQADVIARRNAIDEMGQTRQKAVSIIRATLVNRLVKFGIISPLTVDDLNNTDDKLSEVVDLVEVTTTQGYYHDVQRGRNYEVEPLTTEESLRALEPATMIKLKQSNPKIAAEVIRAVSEVGNYLNQYSILIAGPTPIEGKDIGEAEIVVGDSGERLPVLQSAQHKLDLLEDVYTADSEMQGLRELVTNENTYRVIAQTLAKQGFAGATFDTTSLELLYIQDYDPNRRGYDEWKRDLETALDTIKQQLIEQARARGLKVKERTKLPARSLEGSTLPLMVVYKGGNADYKNFADYTTVNSEDNDDLRARVASILV